MLRLIFVVDVVQFEVLIEATEKKKNQSVDANDATFI